MVKFEGIKKRQNSSATINLLTFFSFPVLIQEFAISFTPYFPHLTGCPSFTKTTTKNQGFLQGNNTDNWDAKIFSLVDKIKIKDFLQSEDPIILSEVFLKLDHQPDSKWQSLGLKLGMEHDDLQQIKIDCANQNENPAHGLIEYIYRREPTMTMAIFKKHLTNIQRNDVEYKLDSMKGVFVMSSHNCNIIQTLWILINLFYHASSQTSCVRVSSNLNITLPPHIHFVNCGKAIPESYPWRYFCKDVLSIPLILTKPWYFSCLSSHLSSEIHVSLFFHPLLS